MIGHCGWVGGGERLDVMSTSTKKTDHPSSLLLHIQKHSSDLRADVIVVCAAVAVKKLRTSGSCPQYCFWEFEV